MKRPQTLTEKILASHSIGSRSDQLKPGDVIRIKVDWTIASELAWNGMNKTYELLGRPPIYNKERFYLAIDHTVDPVTIVSDPRVQKMLKLSRAFASEASLTHFYDANETIMHTKFYRDLVLPGEVVLGADSHTCSHGGLGAFAIGLGGADITVAMTLGESWIEVPESIAIVYRGELTFGIGGKDVILKTLGTLGRNTVAFERSVEFIGPAVKEFSTDMRFTISNMTAEFGGLNGIFEPDGIVKAWIDHREESKYQGGEYYRADPNAEYSEKFEINLSELSPQIAKPFSPDNTVDIGEVVGQTFDGCFIGACTTTEEELVLAAMILELALDDGLPVKETNNRLVAPGDLNIEAHLRDSGLLDVYKRAGYRIAPPGCHLCLGIASERAGKGEIWLSSQNRNYQNRMGEGSLAWLSSAAVVAASSLDLQLRDPRKYLQRIDQERYRKILGRSDLVRVSPDVEVTYSDATVNKLANANDFSQSSAPKAKTKASAPTEIRSAVQLFGDHIDTDAMIPGEFCHLSDLNEIGAKCFHYVRPEFVGRCKNGQRIVVGGAAWGSGSSREHAVWALKGAGVELVIAKSFAFIHKRNLVNEALPFLVLTDDKFYDTVGEGDELKVDIAMGVVTHISSGKTFTAQAPAAIVSAIAREGGIVSAYRRHEKNVFSALTG